MARAGPGGSEHLQGDERSQVVALLRGDLDANEVALIARLR